MNDCLASPGSPSVGVEHCRWLRGERGGGARGPGGGGGALRHTLYWRLMMIMLLLPQPTLMIGRINV
jgi:hypothetical protein